MKLIYTLSLIFSASLFAGDLGPFSPNEIKLNSENKKFIFVFEGQAGEVKLKNYYNRVAYHEKYDAPKGKEDHIFGPIIFDVLKKEYEVAVTTAQVSHQKVDVDLPLLEKIEFLSKFQYIYPNSMDQANSEVIAYMDFLKLDPAQAKNEIYKGELDRVLLGMNTLNNKITNIKGMIAEKKKDFPDLEVDVAALRKSCDVDAKSFLTVQNETIIANYPQYKLSLCLSNKFKYSAEKAEYATLYILEKVLATELSPLVQARIDEVKKLIQDLKITSSSIDLKKAREIFLADYEVLESKMTKVFKVVAANDIRVNEGNQSKVINPQSDATQSNAKTK